MIPTIIVALAVAAMIALGIWQLQRAPQKEAFIARLRANPAKPAIPFPAFPDDSLLFRRASAMCLQPTSQKLEGAGAAGYRLIALCRTGVEGPGMIVQMGTTRDPKFASTWRGGDVSGYISHAPDGRSLIGSLFDKTPRSMMLVSSAPAPGLAANAPPNPDTVPNNHRSYAVQWFAFAGIAAAIYAIALWRRRGAG